MEPNTGVRILQLTLANNIIFTLINPTFQPFNVKSQVNSIPVLLCADSNDHMTLCLYISLGKSLRLCSHCKRTGEARRSDAKRGEARQSEAARQRLANTSEFV